MGVAIAIVVVVALVPISIATPAAIVLVPPPVLPLPATLPCFLQSLPSALGLLAAIPVVLDRFVQLMIGAGHTPLAVVTVVIGPK